MLGSRVKQVLRIKAHPETQTKVTFFAAASRLDTAPTLSYRSQVLSVNPSVFIIRSLYFYYSPHNCSLFINFLVHFFKNYIFRVHCFRLYPEETL